jgi:hypothetical protein
MALSKRDTRILYVILAMGIVYLLWLFGVQPVYQQYVELNDDLTRQQDQFRKNQKTLAEANSIEQGYKRVEAQFPPDVPEKDPADVFSEEVTSLVSQVMGKQPTISPTTREPIKGAKGYELLSFPITIKEAELKSVAELFKLFDQRGYLVQSTIINRNANLDKNDLLVDITLARIVKPEEQQAPVRPVRPGLHIGGAPAAKGRT